MASGFFFGGAAPGITQGANAISQDMQLAALNQLQVAQNEHNLQMAQFMDLRKQTIEFGRDAVTHLKNAHPDWTENQIMSDPSVISQIQRLQDFDKRLKLPDTAQSIFASFAAGPSEIQTARMKAEATGTYGKELAETQEAQAKTRFLNQSAPPPSNPDLDTETQLGGKQFKSTGNATVDNVIKGVENGDLPPVVSGNVSYKDRTAFASGIEANGINLSQRQLQWKQAEKLVQSLNGPQMVRYVGLNKSVQGTIDEALRLSNEMKLSGVPALNSLELQKYIQTEGNSPNGQLATKYIGVINTLKEEFANLAQGGYAPTDPAWKLADEQINSNYGWKQLPATLLETKKLINIRLHAIPGIDLLGPGAGNQYTDKSKPQGPQDDFQPVPGVPGATFRQVK